MRSAVLIGLLIIPGVAISQTLSRKVAFTPNQQLEKVNDMKLVFAMDAMGQSVEITTDNNVTSLVVVKNVSNKGVDFTQTVKHIVTHAGAMGQDMSYDSEKPEDADNELGKSLKDLVGKAVNFSIDNKGVITAADTSQTDLVKMNGMAGGILEGMGTGGFKTGNMLEFVAPLPEKGVKAGGTWDDSVVTKEVKQVNHYKLVSITGNVATIAQDGTLNTKGEAETNGMTVNMEMKATVKGEILMDITTGVIKKRTSDVKGGGTMEMMGQSIPYTIKMSLMETVANK